MEINISRLQNCLLALAKIGARPDGGISRLALTDEDKLARDLVSGWMREAGLTISIDEMGNIFARREGSSPHAPPVLMGSHLDTVVAGGKFDGALGVMGALEVVKTLNENRIVTEHPVEIVIFTNEEGARYQPAMMASGVLVGDIPLQVAYSTEDRAGKSFQAELTRIGYQGQLKCGPRPIKAYLEYHIEQGPVLESKGIAIGIVEGIVGIAWLNIEVIGEADHAGPTPMDRRKDALVSASEIISLINRIPEELGGNIVVTVGYVNVQPNVINVIPGSVNFSVDIRSFDDGKVSQAKELLRDRASKLCREKGTRVAIRELWHISPIHFSEEILQAIGKSCQELGYPTLRMISGAGHDAGCINQITSTGMIFVPSLKGKSHCKEEDSRWEDIEKGTRVLLHTVVELSGIAHS